MSGMRRTVGSDGGTARGVDPDLGAVDAQLLLPNGNAPLYLFDHEAAGVEGLRPMRRRGGDANARLARRDRAEPVTHGDARLRPARAGIREQVTDFRVHNLLVGRILDGRHAAFLRSVAHRAENDARAAA